MTTIHHAVYFWLRNTGSAEDREALIAGLKTLRGIAEVGSLDIGVPAPIAPRPVVDASYDVVELMTFASVADHDAYQVHPLHKAFIAQCSHLWERVQIYDTQLGTTQSGDTHSDDKMAAA